MKFILIPVIIFILFISSSLTHAVYAQNYKFELGNPSAPPAAGDTFDVKVLINTAGNQTLGGDAIIVFDDSKLSVKSAVTGKFYDVFQDHAIGGTTNKYLLSAWQTTELNPVSSSTDTLFSTVTFTAKAGGSTSLSLDCTSGTTDSNIWNTTQTDILKCADSTPLTINIGGGGGTANPTATPAATATPAPTATPAATLTPKPTSTPVPTNTPRPIPTQLPRSGSAETTVAFLGLGAVLTVVGLLIIL